jgi:hypothetical protein
MILITMPSLPFASRGPANSHRQQPGPAHGARIRCHESLASGDGRQANLGGGSFDYPPEAFSRGLTAGCGAACLSARQQRFRRGYEHRPQDLHDLTELDAIPDQ